MPRALDPEAGQRRERAPSRGEPEIGVEAAAEELEVVGEHGQRRRRRRTGAASTRRRTGRRSRCRPRRRARPRPATASARSESPGPERVAVELVERVRRDPDRQEERTERRPQARRVELGRRRGAERHVAQMPGRVRGMKDRDDVAPSARGQGVERGRARGRPLGAPSRRPPQPSRTPENTTPPPRLIRRTRTSRDPGRAARARPGARAATARRAPRCSDPGSGRPRTTPCRTPCRQPAARAACRGARAAARAAGRAVRTRAQAIRPPGLTTRASSARVAAGSST